MVGSTGNSNMPSSITLNDAALILDAEQTIVAVNDRATELYGYEPKELLGQPLSLLRDGDIVMASQWNEALVSGSVHFEAIHRKKDRSPFPVEVSSRRFVHDGSSFVSSLVRDITYQKGLERSNNQLQRVYEALSGANECLIRSQTRQELFDSICQIAVKYANFALVRITQVPDASMRLETVAMAGMARDLASSLLVDVDSNSRYSRGVTGRAILGARSIVEPSFLQDSDSGPWQEALVRARVVSAAAMPIYCQNRVFGAISFYGSQPELFQPRFIRVLQCLADDITHALNRLDEMDNLRSTRIELATVNQRYEQLLAGSSDLVAAWDTDRRLVLCSPSFQAQMLGGARGTPTLGAPMPGDGQTDSPMGNLADYQRRTLLGQDHRVTLTIPRDREPPLYLDTQFSPLRDASGQITGGFQIARDITQLVATHDRLETLSFALEHLPVPLRVLSAAGETEFTNLAYTKTWPELSGQGKEAWERGPLWHRNPGLFVAMKQGLSEQGSWSQTGAVGAPTGDQGWFDIVAWRITNGEGVWTKTIEFYFDVTARKVAEADVEFLRRYDQLTGLPNKASGEDWLECQLKQTRASGGTIGVLLINLDRFWVVNDNLGHGYGDQVLRIMAARLREFEGPDCHLSRMGSDEFLLCVPREGTAEDYLALGRTLTHRLGDPMDAVSAELRLTASIGITLSPLHGDNSHTLISRARSALETAKASGRDFTVVYQPQQHRISPDYLGISRDLFASIREEHFFLDYQPQLDLGTYSVTGAEALLRWRHPNRGVVPPQDFIRVAEDNGLIIPMGSWVLRESCRQAMEWPVHGRPLTIAVNVSASQLYRGDFVSVVSDTLEQTGLDPTRLELELTESMLVQDNSQVRQVLSDLRALGIRLSIDDFGTGYSCLSYLKKLDVQRLKIDRSFVSDLDTNLDGRSIVRAIIEMARAMNLETIAEGVETQTVAEILRDLGCQEVQGYHFSRPVPGPSFNQTLSSLRERFSVAAD